MIDLVIDLIQACPPPALSPRASQPFLLVTYLFSKGPSTQACASRYSLFLPTPAEIPVNADQT
jgi:hypothetical protein